MDWGSILGSVFSGGAGLLGNLFGSNSQSSSLEDAIKTMRQQLKFQKQVYGDTVNREAPFNALALERSRFGNAQLPTIQNRLDNPTLSPGFALASKEGLDTLRNTFSTSGSPSSGPAALASGRFMEGITNNELNRFNENLFRAAGFQGQQTPSQGPSVVNQIGNTSSDIAGLLQNQGAVKGGLYSSIGNTLGQLPYLWQLQGLRKTDNASPSGWGQPDMSWSGAWAP